MVRISEEHAKKLGIFPELEAPGDTPKTRHDRKYKNKKPVVDGHKFDSQKEANYYKVLKMAKQSGDIEELELQPLIRLQDGFDDKEGNHHRPINYKPDFRIVWADGREEYVDVKGYKTAIYKIKKKLLLKKYPDINFREVEDVPDFN